MGSGVSIFPFFPHFFKLHRTVTYYDAEDQDELSQHGLLPIVSVIHSWNCESIGEYKNVLLKWKKIIKKTKCQYKNACHPQFFWTKIEYLSGKMRH